MNFKVNDRVFSPAVGLDGQVISLRDVPGSEVNVWWSDDEVSWEDQTELRLEV